MSKLSRVILGLIIVGLSLSLMINAGETSYTMSGTASQDMMDVFDYEIDVILSERQGYLIARVDLDTTSADSFGTYNLNFLLIEFGDQSWKIETDIESEHEIEIDQYDAIIVKSMSVSVSFNRFFVIDHGEEIIKETFWIRSYPPSISTLLTVALVLGLLVTIGSLIFNKEKEGSGLFKNAPSSFQDDGSFDLIYKIDSSKSSAKIIGILIFAIPFLAVPGFMLFQLSRQDGSWAWAIILFIIVFIGVAIFIFSRILKGMISEQYIYSSDTELIKENVYFSKHEIDRWYTEDIFEIVRAKTFHISTSSDSEGRSSTSSYYVHEILLDVSTYDEDREIRKMEKFLALRENQAYIIDAITRSLHEYGFEVRLENISMNLGSRKEYSETDLKEQEMVCPSCGLVITTQEEYCIECGSSLKSTK